ncbi:hypothetical protein [Sodalis glossinidius]|uniref:hypothetical protein n=1 Tax=Sodalis glossinidius TaxID=63612 RepID=UPI000680A624|nr:hypothetical protein [Sodalis glossinidius]
MHEGASAVASRINLAPHAFDTAEFASPSRFEQLLDFRYVKRWLPVFVCHRTRVVKVDGDSTWLRGMVNPPRVVCIQIITGFPKFLYLRVIAPYGLYPLHGQLCDGLPCLTQMLCIQRQDHRQYFQQGRQLCGGERRLNWGNTSGEINAQILPGFVCGIGFLEIQGGWVAISNFGYRTGLFQCFGFPFV